MTETTRTPAISVEYRNSAGEQCGVDESPAVMRITSSEGHELIVTSADLRHHHNAFAWHGAKQKLIDAAAISRNPDTGKSATVEDKFQALKEVADRVLTGGTWNKVREGGSGGGALLLRALMEVFGKSESEVRAFLDGKTPKEQAAMRTNPRIAPVITRLQAERAADVDSDALLGELDA